jgi:hypothetical protein
MKRLAILFIAVVVQEMSTGQNETAVRNPGATRSVIYTNSDKSKKVTISVDQYATSSDASAAYEEAVQKSRSVPGFRPIDAPNLGPQAFIGTVTRGTETHIGLGALRGTLIVGVTLVGYEASADTTAKLVSLAREEEKAADAIIGAISRAVKEKIDALVQAQPAQRVTPGIAVAISKNGRTNADGERNTLSNRLGQ